MKVVVDKKNKYISKFDTMTGFYVRSGVIEGGKDTGIDPFMSSFPELLDVGVMGYCIHGHRRLCVKSGVSCYQDGMNKMQPNMLFKDFKRIVDECKDRTFQIALGGRGDPNKHEDFEKLVSYSRKNGVVPNYTTSGLDLTDYEVGVTKEYCGAVAVSWYRQKHTYRALNKFLRKGIITNIHYVLSRKSIDEAISMLREDGFPKGINAVIFLLHKPVGLGRFEDVLRYDDRRLKEFFELVDKKEMSFDIGFDSCSVPGIINFMENYDSISLDTCEGARWSAYISPDMKMTPCSFDQSFEYAYSLRDNSIENVWKQEMFERFRDDLKNYCLDCLKKDLCMGGCPLMREIVLCQEKNRKVV